MGRNVSDEFALPLYVGHHRELHRVGNERKWWGKRKIDPAELARELWEATRSWSGEPILHPNMSLPRKSQLMLDNAARLRRVWGRVF